MENHESKICASCGRTIEWRKKWERDWGSVRYCSERCRRAKRDRDPSLEGEILARLDERGAGKTICPSELLDEAAKQDPARMEEVREAARRLVAKGIIEITQKGKAVDPSNFRGPIRLRKLEKK